MMVAIYRLFEKAGVNTPEISSLSDHQQLELLKTAMHGRWIELAQYFPKKYYMGKIDFKRRFQAETFEECLAGIVLLLWEDFGEKEKEEVRDILRGKE